MSDDREEIARQRLGRVRDGEFLTTVYGANAEKIMADLQSDLEAILARAQGPGPGEAVADAWVMVPREPTEAMLVNGREALLPIVRLPIDAFGPIKAIWSDMLAATPTRESAHHQKRG